MKGRNLRSRPGITRFHLVLALRDVGFQARQACLYGEEVHGCNGLAMVPEKCQPASGGIWSSRASPEPSRDSDFPEMKAQFQQLAVNARRSPGWILSSSFCWRIVIALGVSFRNVRKVGPVPTKVILHRRAWIRIYEHRPSIRLFTSMFCGGIFRHWTAR
jgi:hypothetical protein